MAVAILYPCSKTRIFASLPDTWRKSQGARLFQTRLSLVCCSSPCLCSLLTPSPGNTARQHADPFADQDPFVDTTPAGVPVAPIPTTQPEQQPPQPDPTPLAAPPKPPLYKRRWFIITSVIGACLGIALLFIVLFPVVRAIVQDIVNETTLDITTAAITNPTNTS